MQFRHTSADLVIILMHKVIRSMRHHPRRNRGASNRAPRFSLEVARGIPARFQRNSSRLDR
jgi:hypothetical protein